MPTIKGLRRRGYIKETLNGFCNDVGVTRNNNTVDVTVLFNWARNTLDDLSPRVMGVFDPLAVTITNHAQLLATLGASSNVIMTSEIPAFPLNPEKGSHTLEVTPELFIDRSDFREQDEDSFYGLAPGKTVFLKYVGKITCEDVEKDHEGKILRLLCSIKTTAQIEAEESKEETKPKGALTWVPSTATSCEIRLYNHLFSVPEPDDQWEEQLNPESEVVMSSALVDPSIRSYHLEEGAHFQLERWGYFVVDKDSTATNDSGKQEES
jgi:glutaminyl-tRNA synthetase